MNSIFNENTEKIVIKNQLATPVNVTKIANELKINVYTALGEEGVAGKIIKDSLLGGESGYAIVINRHDAPRRQRFTIAHEISHFILHKDLIGDGIVDDALYRSGLSNKIEREANKLAADILMPWHLINEFMSEKIKTIQDLANIFQVSESAMSIRLGIPC